MAPVRPSRQEWRQDVARAFVLLTVGFVLQLVIPDAAVRWHPGLPLPSFAAEVGVLAFACAGVVVRRGSTLVGLAVATAALLAGPFVAGGTHVAVLIVFGEMLYSAVLYTSRRTSRAVVVTAVAAIGLVTVLAFVGQGGRAAVTAVLNLSLLVVVPVWWAHEVRQHRERADVERERADRERRMAELDRAAAVTAERNRMARDLHDVIAGQLSAIAIQSEAALTIPDADPAVLRRVLAEVRRGSVSSLAEMRTMIGLLRADADPDEPRTAPAGLDRVDALLDAGRASGLSVELDDRRPPGEAVPAAVDLAAYRIVQEALVNAAKHAPGSTVRLALRHEDGELRVEVENDIVHDAPAGGGTGTGLLGLEERAAAVGGRVDAGPRGSRWSVRAALPAGATA